MFAFPGASLMEDIGLPSNLAEMSAGALLVTTVAFIIVAMFRGWIVVKLHYDTLLARAVAAEAANERLTANNAALTENNAKLAASVIQQGAVGETMEKLVSAIQDQREKAVGTQ